MNGQAVIASAADYEANPSTISEARDMREAAIVELAKISAQLGRASGGMREFLKSESVKMQARLRGLNKYIAGQCGAQGSDTRPSKDWRLGFRMEIPKIANLPERAAGAETACRCGEVVTAQRARSAFVYYCQSCGFDWSEPAPIVAVRIRREPVKRCKCSHACRFCGGVKGR